MRSLIIILTIASFLQSTILPINLILIILIARALIRPGRANLILSFAFGLLLSQLNLQLLGFQSLISLILIQFTQILTRSRLSANPLIIVPLAFVASSFNLVSSSFLIHQSPQLMPQVLLDSVLALPIFYLVESWEERFIIRKEIKLRV